MRAERCKHSRFVRFDRMDAIFGRCGLVAWTGIEGVNAAVTDIVQFGTRRFTGFEFGGSAYVSFS